jgi:NAD(P)-dependent dehydrogenase (short-subunit alcohol dehydrogenase family)
VTAPRLDRPRFDGKTALITGAAGGIGRAAAVRFAAEGARVGLVDVSRDGLRESLAAVEKAGGTGLTIEADVTRSADVTRYAATVAERLGGIDYFFNNAGILGAVRALVDYPEDVFDRVLAINVKGVWLGIKTVAPLLRARGGGVIVNTASIAGLRGSRNLVAYTASKHAVVGITRSAALELAPDRIRVNAVCPSPIETDMVRQLEAGANPGNPAAFHDRMAGVIPMKRYGTPDEVAALVLFLCSADAVYITGAIYPVDGGSMA